MRRLLLALILTTTSPLSAQVVEQLQFGRPNFATAGRETFPMLLIEEAALGPNRYARIPFPKVYWDEMRTCLFKNGLVTNADSVGTPPDILIIPPGVRTFRVHDLITDSLAYAEDSTHLGEIWGPPTVGYALIQSNFILAAYRFHKNKYMMRHEALHFLLWRQKRMYGHPIEFFGPCDQYYE